jgi:hypothetical protein
MSDDDDKSSGDTSLFAIFAFSLLALVVIPLTIWRLLSGASHSADDVLQPWQKVRVPKCSKRMYSSLQNSVPSLSRLFHFYMN